MAREKLIGTDFSDYFTEPEKARDGYQQVFAKGFVTDYPLTIRHRDGHLTDVLYNASVYRDEKGEVLGVFAAARDVTEQKKASQYARSLIEASLDPLVTISPEGKITDVNEASVKVTGVSRDKLIGTDFSDYFTEPENARDGLQAGILAAAPSPTTRLPSVTRTAASPTCCTTPQSTATGRTACSACSPRRATLRCRRRHPNMRAV